MRTNALLSALSMLTVLGVASTAAAQPGAGAPPPGPGAAPAAPGAAAPGPGAAPAASPGGGGFGFNFGADSTGANASAKTPAAANPSSSGPAPTPAELDRDAGLYEMPTITGSTGLLRVASARSAPVGTFRLQVLWEYYSGSEFLCSGQNPCSGVAADKRTKDSANRFGANFYASATPLSFLEGYVAIRSYATANDAGRPELLQVLGDTIIGTKLFWPTAPNRMLNFGGDLQLLLLNGTGGVGLDGGGTSFRMRGDATLDFRKADGGIPLLTHLNLGYKFDNSGKVIEGTETNRNQPISRVERFGLGINRTDAFEIGLGVEGVFKLGESMRYLRPFMEYTVDVPVNRQGYTCDPDKAFASDGCLGNDAGFNTTPSRFTLGVRGNPVLKGLMATLALDIGTGATSHFIEEVAPQTPWTIWWGLGYAADLAEKPKFVEKIVQGPERVVMTPPPPQFYVDGFVHENGRTEGLPNAIIRYEGREITGMVTNGQGKFHTTNLEPGKYTFNVAADGYKPGTCSVEVAAANPGASPDAGAFGGPGAPPGPGAPAAPGAPPGPGADPNAPPPGGGPTPSPVTNLTVDCSLEALPRVGNVAGRVVAAEGGAGVANATVELTDSQNKMRTLSTDGDGKFKAEGLPPGTVKIVVKSEEYLGSSGSVDVKVRDTASTTISMNKRPKLSNVTITKNEIVIRQQVHFETDSAKIMSDSSVLLEEIADAINRTPKIKVVEVQGHTDNSGTPQRNKTLSEERAAAVRDRLVQLGVASSRLQPKGYGDTMPIAPNFGPGKARNRRVAFKIVEQDK